MKKFLKKESFEEKKQQKFKESLQKTLQLVEAG